MKTVRKPVIAVRVPKLLYELIRNSAHDQGIAMSEEVERRLRATFELDVLRSYAIKGLCERLDRIEQKLKRAVDDGK